MPCTHPDSHATVILCALKVSTSQSSCKVRRAVCERSPPHAACRSPRGIRDPCVSGCGWVKWRGEGRWREVRRRGGWREWWGSEEEGREWRSGGGPKREEGRFWKRTPKHIPEHSFVISSNFYWFLTQRTSNEVHTLKIHSAPRKDRRRAHTLAVGCTDVSHASRGKRFCRWKVATIGESISELEVSKRLCSPGVLGELAKRTRSSAVF